MPSSGGPGVLVDASSGEIDTVRFVSCYSARWPGPGLQLSGGAANVEVLGGMYAGNNYSSSSQAYGIYVEEASGVRISGVSCVGQYIFIQEGMKSPSPNQDVGIYLDSGASDVTISGCDIRLNKQEGIVVNGASGVTISGCDLTSNTGTSSGIGILVNGGSSNVNIDGCDVRNNGINGIKVDGSVSAVSDIYIRSCNATGYGSYSTAINISSVTSNQGTVQVTNSAGYNDQGVTLTTTPPSSATVFYNYTFGYFGPFEFYFTFHAGTTVSNIKIDGTITGLTSGSFYLVPGENGEITYSGGTSPVGFVAIAK